MYGGVVMMGNTCQPAGCRRLGHPHIPLLPHDPHEISILLIFQTLQQYAFFIVSVKLTLEAFTEMYGANLKRSKDGGGISCDTPTGCEINNEKIYPEVSRTRSHFHLIGF